MQIGLTELLEQWDDLDDDLKMNVVQEARDEIERLKKPERTDTNEPTDEEIKEVFGNASFGKQTPKQVLRQGILKVALGYGNGFTLTTILHDLGMIQWDRATTESRKLWITPRGRYLCWKWYIGEESA